MNRFTSFGNTKHDIECSALLFVSASNPNTIVAPSRSEGTLYLAQAFGCLCILSLRLGNQKPILADKSLSDERGRPWQLGVLQSKKRNKDLFLKIIFSLVL